jgi:hypothetical protein
MQNVVTTEEHYTHCGKAITWPSVFAGAVAALSVSLILLILGSGLGLSVASPWKPGPTATTLSVAVISWLIIMQWVSSALGGYFAGRLRTKHHATLHGDEAFFRDTAHGFLSWAVATIVVAAFSASTLTAGLSGSAKVAGLAAGAGAASMAPKADEGKIGPADHNMYLVDTLFRSPSSKPNTAPTAADTHETRGEATRILVTGIKNGDVSEQDRTYLTQLVAARANISQAEAAKRVDDTIATMKADEDKLKQAADSARKTASTLSVFTFLSLLIGAFIASVSGALGGKQRDEF